MDVISIVACLNDGCEAPVSARGQCERHYRLQLAMRASQCAEDECTNRARGRGLCSRHLKQLRKASAAPCAKAGCANPGYAAGGLCPTHYNASRATSKCGEARCPEPANSRGLCKKHYARARKVDRPRCAVEGCRRSATASHGLCWGHYTRLRRYGDVGPADIGRSAGESAVASALDALGLRYIEEMSWGGASKGEHEGRFDFCVPSLRLLIEYDGVQHYTPRPGWHADVATWIAKVVDRDRAKSDAAFAAGYNLLRIPYWTPHAQLASVIQQAADECLHGIRRVDYVDLEARGGLA